IGTPAVTTRGFTETEMLKVAEFIDTVLTKKDDATIARVKADVRELADQFPLDAPPARAAVAGGYHAREQRLLRRAVPGLGPLHGAPRRGARGRFQRSRPRPAGGLLRRARM